MVAEQVYRYIVANLSPYADVGVDRLSEDKESISMQAGRGNPQETTYMNGDKTGSFPFEIRAKSANRAKANNWLISVVNHFQANQAIPLGERIFFSAAPLISPYLYEVAEDGGFIYTAQFNVEYDERVI